MIRLMCSTDRKEVEWLKSELFRAGIRSEICSNPVAAALGITRLEINIYDSDIIEASRIHKEFLETRDSKSVSDGATSGANGRSSRAEVEVEVEPKRAPVRAQLGPGRPEQPQAGQEASSGSNLAQAAELLEKEVEEVLARDNQLADQCAALQNRVEALEGALAQLQAELARESLMRSEAEQKLGESNVTRGSVEKELGVVNQRLRTTEQSLAVAHGQLESQTRELKLQQTKMGDLNKEMASRDSQLGTLAELLAQTRSALENEKGLRQISEQKLSEHAATRKSLEQKVNHFTELQAQLQEQNNREREQVQTYLDTVNKLRSRLSQKRN